MEVLSAQPANRHGAGILRSDPDIALRVETFSGSSIKTKPHHFSGEGVRFDLTEKFLQKTV